MTTKYFILLTLKLFILVCKEQHEDLIPAQYLDDCDQPIGRLSWIDGDEYCTNSIIANTNSLFLEISGSNLDCLVIKLNLYNLNPGTYSILDRLNAITYTRLKGKNFKSDKDNPRTLTINFANKSTNKVKDLVEVIIYDSAFIAARKIYKPLLIFLSPIILNFINKFQLLRSNIFSFHSFNLFCSKFNKTYEKTISTINFCWNTFVV